MTRTAARLVTAWAEPSTGQGCLDVVWALTVDRAGELRLEGLTGDDISPDMRVLFSSSAATSAALAAVVRRDWRPR